MVQTHQVNPSTDSVLQAMINVILDQSAFGLADRFSTAVSAPWGGRQTESKLILKRSTNANIRKIALKGSITATHRRKRICPAFWL